MTIELGVIISITSVMIAVLGYQLNKQKQATEYQTTIKNDATREAVIETKLDSISLGVENIRIDLRANERQVGAMNERLTRVEESSKQAHKRLDKIKNEGE
jgi:molybdopterin-biosynthesis enzyme MoeA-like protein